MLGAVLLEIVTTAGDGIDLSISNLPALYGFFYAVYYLTPLVLFGFRNDVSRGNIIEISALMLLGYAGWRSGLALSGHRKGALRIPVFGDRDARSLLILCWLGFGLVMVGYGYKISVGCFYTHGADFAQETNLAASFLQNATFPFEFPVITLLALLSAAGGVQKPAKKSLYIVVGILCIVHLLAGEFRAAVTALTLIVAVFQFATGFRLTWYRLAAGSCIFALMLLSIQGSRIVAEARGGGVRGPLESASLFVDGIVAATDGGNGAAATTRTSQRASGPVVFISSLIDRVGTGSPYIYGKVMLNQLSSLLPRAVWPDKPAFSSAQILIKREFGMRRGGRLPGGHWSHTTHLADLWECSLWLFAFGFFLGRLQVGPRTAMGPCLRG